MGERKGHFGWIGENMVWGSDELQNPSIIDDNFVDWFSLFFLLNTGKNEKGNSNFMR